MHTHPKALFQAIGIVLTFGFSHVTYAKQDANNYLEALSAEAEKGGAVAETVPTQPQLKINANSTPAQLAKTHQGFENILQSKFAATYFIYSKLSNAQKQKVFQRYQKSGDFGQVRSLVLEIFQNR